MSVNISYTKANSYFLSIKYYTVSKMSKIINDEYKQKSDLKIERSIEKLMSSNLEQEKIKTTN